MISNYFLDIEKPYVGYLNDIDDREKDLGFLTKTKTDNDPS